MGFWDFGGDDYYASDAQIINESSAEAPYESMLDYNLCLLDGQVSLTGWSNLYFNSGKGCLTKYAKYIKYLEKHGNRLLDCYISINSDVGAKPDSTVLTMVLNDLGYSTEDVKSTTISLLNPNANTRLYIEYLLEDYNYNDDNVTVDGIIYTIKSFDYIDISTILVTLEDTEGNTIEKEIPMFTILDNSDTEIQPSDYLYAEFTTKEDDIKHVFMQQVPVANGVNVYTYTDKNGTSYDYTISSQTRINVLPLIPVKQGGDGQGWEPAIMTAYRKYKSRATKGSPKTWFDYTGVSSIPNDVDAGKWVQEKYRNKLYKKCKFEGRRYGYEIYKKASKQGGMDLRQQVGILYDGQCYFMPKEIEKPWELRDQIYDVYYGYGCPLHGVKSTNILQHPISEFETVYARLLKDTENPFIAEYAKWSRYTDEQVLDSDTETTRQIKEFVGDVPTRSSLHLLGDKAYFHKYFIEINKKKYKPLTVKAIAKYMYLFFDLYNNSATHYGKKISFIHSQNSYYATHSWTQYKKTSHEGKLKYKYSYGFSAQKTKQYYLYTVNFTGKYDVKKEYQAETSNWKLTYKPIYAISIYSCTIEKELTDDSFDFSKISGIPIQATYYDENYNVLNTFTDDKGNTYNYTTIGMVSYTDPSTLLSISNKSLINIKETTSLTIDNITFADSTLTSTSTTTNEDGTTTTVTNTKGTYATDTTELYTASFYGDLDVTKLNYDAEVMEYTEIKEGTEDTPPEASTDIPYDNFSTSLFPETEITYIFVSASKEDNTGTSGTFRYMYQYDASHYYEIKVTGYSVVWKINMYEDHQEKTAPYSGLAPDGAGFIPLIPSIVKKLSLQEGMIIRNYALKQYWSFWVKQHVSWWDHYGKRLVIAVAIIVIEIVIAVATGGTSLSWQAVLTKALIAALTSLAIHEIIKLLGLNNTILGTILELAANLAAGYGLSNISSLNITFDFNFIGKQVLNTLQNLTNLVLNRRMEDIAQDFQNEEEKLNDVQVEIENAQNQSGIGLATQATVRRLRGQNLTIPETYAIATTVVTDTIAMYNNSVAQMGYNYVKNSTTVTLPCC